MGSDGADVLRKPLQFISSHLRLHVEKRLSDL